MHKSNELFLNILPKEQRNFPAAVGEFRCHSLHSAQILNQFDATAWVQRRICDQCRLDIFVGPGMLRRSKIFIVTGLKHAISSVGAASIPSGQKKQPTDPAAAGRNQRDFGDGTLDPRGLANH